MKKNIGRTDGIIRIIVAVAILFFMDGLSGTIELILVITAAILLFTAFNGFCLLYKPFGFSTRKEDKLNS